MGWKQTRRNFIVEQATLLFISSSIEKVTMRDIALACEIGEATLYRYFGKKQAIVMASVMSLQSFIDSHYFQLDKGHNGFEKLSIFYRSYLDIFVEHPEFYRFLGEVDSYILSQDDSFRDPYEEKIDTYRHAFSSAYEEGVKDGSVQKKTNIDLVYFSSTHALLELCKKLSMTSNVLKQDERNPKQEEIACLIDLILNSFRSCAPSASKKDKESDMEEGR